VVPAGPLRELKDLVYEAYLAAGAPTLNEMAAAIADLDPDDDSVKAAPSRDTIQRIIKTPAMPARQGDVVALVTVLTRMAGGEADQAARLTARLWLDARLERPLGQPICELDPIDLEVHRAIQVEEGPRFTGSAPLPVYVSRPHDRVLRQAVDKAVAGQSQLVMLVGGSSTGKTRACWEAVQQLPAGWRLWHPIDPERPGAALASLAHVAPRTVVWINESHHYLFTPDRSVGEQVAAGLRELLRDPARAPVLVLGTIWPEYRNKLMAEPVPGGPDPHAQARALLSGHEAIVPAAFDDAAMHELAALARTDPRLAYARARAEEGHITQYLAGAPELLARFEASPPGARALVVAAMDARRAGHGLDIPHAFLASASDGYFTDQEWDLLDEDWLEEAFAYAAQPVRGARGMLTRRRPRRGDPAVEGPVYRLADYLEQHGRQTRRLQRIPPSLWEAALRHTPSGPAMARLARSCGLLRTAFQLERREAASGHNEAARRAGDVLRRAGREKEALLWYQKAAEAGDPEAALVAGQLLFQHNRLEEALDSFRRAAESGLREAAEDWARRLVHSRAYTGPGRSWMRQPEKTAQDAVTVNWTTYGRRAYLWRDHRVEKADELRAQGNFEEALVFYGMAAEEEPSRYRFGAAALSSEGRIDEAVEWYRRGFEGGDIGAAWRAGRVLREQGRDDEAIDWYQRGAYAGDSTALQRVAYLMRDRGRLDEAVHWAQRSANTGDEGGLHLTAALLRLQGKDVEAAQLLAYGWDLDGSIAEPWGAEETL
jgi:TPR repeat protein